MLTIPDAIKTLFKTDGTRKNFRVHFPNGEYSDITNANVVRESLHFTESLCSQDPFKFGLAEASVIEFETVGIGNMYGKTIVCSIEIDTSSLSAAQISAIQSDPGDGTLVLAADSDIGYGYYRVPYGSFKVTSCPRDHQNMAHRKVTAYSSFTGGDVQNSPFEIAKLAYGIPKTSGNYTPNLPRLITAALASDNPDMLSGYTVATTKTIQVAHSTDQIVFSGLGLDVVVNSHMGTVSGIGLVDPDALYVIDLAEYDAEMPLTWIREQLESGGFGSYADAAITACKRRIVPGDSIRSSYTPPVNGKIVAYPYRNGELAFPNFAMYADTTITIQMRRNGSTTEVTESFDIFNAALSSFNGLSDSFPDIRGNFAATGVSAINSAWNTFSDSYDVAELLLGWMEEQGVFGKTTRDGVFDTVALDDTSPASVAPGDYEECWWDEYDVSPIGTVYVTIDADGGETTADITIGNGASVYDMTDNALLKCLYDTSVSDIETLLNGDFAANAAKVGFTPVDLTMQGWPWIEAGDALQITAEDGTVVDTYALRVELSGIQRLSASIESSGGNIIGEV